MRRERKDEIEEFLAKTDNPNYWRTLYDEVMDISLCVVCVVCIVYDMCVFSLSLSLSLSCVHLDSGERERGCADGRSVGSVEKDPKRRIRRTGI